MEANARRGRHERRSARCLVGNSGRKTVLLNVFADLKGGPDYPPGALEEDDGGLLLHRRNRKKRRDVVTNLALEEPALDADERRMIGCLVA
jgi:hypothetical protein